MILYTIERTEKAITVKKNGHARLNAPPDSYLIYKEGDTQSVSKIRDLSDEKLLLALANAIDIPNP